MQKLYNLENSELLKERRLREETQRTTLSFYVYSQISDPEQFRNELYSMFSKLDVCGRIYIAKEGVNAQLNVPTKDFEHFESALRSIDHFTSIRLNIAVDQSAFSFYKLIIKVRPKIVADGLDDSTFDASESGTHLDAERFNTLSEQKNTVIVDMRNHYESEVGHFENALRPDVETFRASLPIVEELLADKKEQPIIMYCTGGIRCEKASAYFKHKGFTEVYQLDGGIIEYAHKVEELGLENKFIGKNFVFDERMGERISNDIIAKCHQCGATCDDHINCANDACHILFIQCHACAEKYKKCCSVKCKDFDALDDEKKTRFKKTIKFNGTKFGKGRYKALTADESLDLT